MSRPGAPVEVSLVLPTFNRVDALRDTLPSILAVEGVEEIVIVDDASTDATPAFLRTVEDPRVTVLTNPVRRGQPAVRNRGVDASRGAWVVFGEDDCRMPPDYVRAMLADAAEHGADLVGAPWIFSLDLTVEEALAQARATAVDRVVLDQVTRMPVRVLVTPFLPALALVRREVFAEVRFDEAYRGNAYREETDFFVAAVRAGFRSILTPSTYSFQLRRWAGGAASPRIVYEAWSIRNNARFLRRHGDWLAAQGLVDDPARAQRRFAVARVRYAASFYAHRSALWTARRLGLREQPVA